MVRTHLQSSDSIPATSILHGSCPARILSCTDPVLILSCGRTRALLRSSLPVAPLVQTATVTQCVSPGERSGMLRVRFRARKLEHQGRGGANWKTSQMPHGLRPPRNSSANCTKAFIGGHPCDHTAKSNALTATGSNVLHCGSSASQLPFEHCGTSPNLRGSQLLSQSARAGQLVKTQRATGCSVAWLGTWPPASPLAIAFEPPHRGRASAVQGSDPVGN